MEMLNKNIKMRTGAHILHWPGTCNVGEVCWLNLTCDCEVQRRLLLFCEDKNRADDHCILQLISGDSFFLFNIQARVIGGKSLHMKLLNIFLPRHC